jgi:hypothetical protein
MITTVEKVKELGLTQQGADTKTISIQIQRCQDIYLRPALGIELLNYILVEANRTGNYETLYDTYILPCVVAYVDYRCAVFLTTKITNKGAGLTTDQNFNANNDAENTEFLASLKADADFYKNELVKYLRDDNGTMFPQYTVVDDLMPKDRTGIVPNWYGSITPRFNNRTNCYECE